MIIDFMVGLTFALIVLAVYDVARSASTTLRACLILCGALLVFFVASILVLDRGTGVTGVRVLAYVLGNAVGQVAKRLRSFVSTGIYVLVLFSLILAAFRDQDSNSEV